MYMYVCMYIYIYIYMYVRIHVCASIYLSIYTHVYTYIYIYIYIYLLMYASCSWPSERALAASGGGPAASGEFRDVVFEDVAFDNDSDVTQ